MSNSIEIMVTPTGFRAKMGNKWLSRRVDSNYPRFCEAAVCKYSNRHAIDWPTRESLRAALYLSTPVALKLGDHYVV